MFNFNCVTSIQLTKFVLCILATPPPKRWPQKRPKHVGRTLRIRYIMNIEVQFVGYLYIMVQKSMLTCCVEYKALYVQLGEESVKE